MIDSNLLSKKNSDPRKTVWPTPITNPIRPCPGFEKKGLATWKIDLMAKCQFACSYCSSNTGNFLRINSGIVKEATKNQLGVEMNARQNAEDFYLVYENIVDALKRQLGKASSLCDREEILQVGMLTDCFSPELVTSGVTYECIKILLEKTKFKLRILSKSASVAREAFIELFQRYPGRVTVGLSCGSMDDRLMIQIEALTSPPSARARAIRRLQAAGIETFGMFCPILPGLTSEVELFELLARFNVAKMKEVWCEPYNDRANWRILRQKMPQGTESDELFKVMTNKNEWQEYAINLVLNHDHIIKQMRFHGTSRYLIYENGMSSDGINILRTIPGVLFQSNPQYNS